MRRKRFLQWIKFVPAVLVLVMGACGLGESRWNADSGILVKPAGVSGIPSAIMAVEKTAPPKIMQGPGLAGVMGGMRLKAFRGGVYDVRIPLPQMSGCQVPVFYSAGTVPEDALLEYRLQETDGGNIAVNLRLKGKKNDEILVEWRGAVLIADSAVTENREPPEQYLTSTACVQSGDPGITRLADRLWPRTGNSGDFAVNIRNFIGGMKQKEQPRSLDALGMLSSGMNSICTSNANLSAALMRAKGVPCRMIATLPTIPRRFEMHRVVEFYDDGSWIQFDPSGVNSEIPLKPWQNIIMTKSSIADEQGSMSPRAGAMYGCPVGQEAEFSRPGLNLFGQDFFWSIAAPLAEFEVTEDSANLAKELWKEFLQKGEFSPAQLKASEARDGESFLEALNCR